MNLKMNIRLVASVGLISFAAISLVACGRVGALDQPAPLFGEQARADYAARRAAVDAAAADNRNKAPVSAADQADPNADNAPRTARDVKDPAQDNLPITQDPISGAPSLMGPTPSLKPPTG